MAGNYLSFIAKLTSKTIDYENVPLERVEKASSPLVQVKSIGQPSGQSNIIQTFLESDRSTINMNVVGKLKGALMDELF